MSSLRRHEGVLLIDHRAGPGMPADVVQQSGLETPIVGAQATYESATYTCSHCHRVVVLNPDRTRAREYCPKCDHRICDGCGAERRRTGGDCLTMNARLDRLQEDAFHLIGKG